jgi:BCCT family betaine/carnitine transporter
MMATQLQDKKSRRIDKPLVVVSLLLIFGLVIYLAADPERTDRVANDIFATGTEIFGPYTLLYAFIALILLLALASSKYGSIRLGRGAPEYSTFSWVSMMLAAGLGSATMVWAFVEWVYYYLTPGLGIEPESAAAYEWALPYNFFHWGFSAWGLYCIVALPVAYHFHVRRNQGLSLSATFGSITGLGHHRWIGKIIDFVFIFTVFGGLSITLGLSIPLIARAVATAVGVQSSFGLELGIVLFVSVLFSLSSYIGIAKGMKRLSGAATNIALVFAGVVLIVGPTMFIVKNSVNGLGLMVQNYVIMSLWTDPIGNSGFPEGWTVFYWLYWLTYTPFMALFVARVSRGRSIRALILNMLGSGSFGLFFFFGVLQSFSIHNGLTGKVDAPAVLEEEGQDGLVLAMLEQLPWSTVFIVAFAVMSVLFLATTLDSASFTLASTTTPDLREGQDPSPFLRLFWAVMLAAVPLTMSFIDADLNTIKTAAIITAIPLSAIVIVLVIGMLRWMRTDYSHLAREEIGAHWPEASTSGEGAHTQG